jgi:hypothetical protein
MGHVNTLAIWTLFLIWSVPVSAGWPALPMPQHSQVQSIGEQVVLNGVPMRMHRIVSSKSPTELLRFYQQFLGGRHTKTETPRGVFLARGDDRYFMTVRISTLDNGLSEVLTSVADGQTAKSNKRKPLGFALPAASQLVMDMESVDTGKSARQLIFNNQHSMQSNADAMTKVLREKGYILNPRMSVKGPDSLNLIFEGDRREARLVVLHNEQDTLAVLTTILSE